MAVFLPTMYVSPPFGDVTVTLGGGNIVNVPLLTSFVPAFDASLTRTRAWLVGALGIVHEKLPVDDGVLADKVAQVAPASVENSILTFVTLADVHVTLVLDPAIYDSPPF